MKQKFIEVCGRGLASLIRRTPAAHPARKTLIRAWEDRYAWRTTMISATTKFGFRMDLRPVDAVQGRILTTGRWEPNITQIVREALKPGDVFIDIGANVGYYTILASSIISASGKVYAIEASPSVFSHLGHNLRLNKAENTVAINGAVTDRAGPCSIFLAGAANLGHSTIVSSLAEAEGHRHEASVRGDILQGFVPLADLLRARLVKIDIEGAERLAIEGFKDHLAGMSERAEFLVELSPEFMLNGEKDVDWIFQTFISAGFRCYQIDNQYGGVDSGGEIQVELKACSVPPAGRLNDVLFSRLR